MLSECPLLNFRIPLPDAPAPAWSRRCLPGLKFPSDLLGLSLCVLKSGEDALPSTESVVINTLFCTIVIS